MLADLDLLLTAVFCTADDLLPEGRRNARRSLTDAEVATLCVAQAVMGIALTASSSPSPSDASVPYSRSCPARAASTSAGGG